MDLFQILIIAAFILFPIMEQVLKRRRSPGPEEPGPDAMETHPGEVDPRPSEREPVKAAEMVPDDLWAILTGEQRPTEGVETADEREPAPPRPEPAPDTAPERWEEAWMPLPEPRWRLEEETPAEPPVRAAPERYGPEAYSLETLDERAVSLEKPLESATVRHRQFHEGLDDLDRRSSRRRRRRSQLGRALRSPQSLRQAIVLTEVLGTPKGLE